MRRTKENIKELVKNQIASIRDTEVKNSLELILTEPIKHLRNWDYGKKGEKFECWTVAIDKSSNTSIIYSDFGFGPKNPWGLVFTNDSWFGMNSGWFNNLLECYLDSYMAGDLAIWCVVKKDENNKKESLAFDLKLDEAFKERDKYLISNPTGKYFVEERKN